MKLEVNDQHSVDYSDGILNTQRLMLMSEFILNNNLEDEYLQFLKGLDIENDWAEFKVVINETITEYEITEDDILQEIGCLVKVKPYSNVC
ncbi:hypothetical protein [Bacillus infantis]|uniref:hypothetical protein n=1 Tax=Bacillus infantis TaxID=324767 RepID=UPI003CE6C00F